MPNPSIPPPASGEYLIRSMSNGLYLAAEASESLQPQKIFTLPRGTRAPKWTLEQIKPCRYLIRIDNASVADVDSKLQASHEQVLEHTPGQDNWYLDGFLMNGENVYTITSASKRFAWVVGNEAPYTQVTMENLGHHVPEQPPMNALFDVICVH